MVEFTYANDVTQDPVSRKRFTVADANRSLVLLRRILGDLVSEYARLTELQEMIETIESGGTCGQLTLAREQLTVSADMIRRYVQELDDIGVVLRDWKMGIIDFPTLIEGRDAYLCWQLEEPVVEYWHEQQCCLGDRKPVEGLATLISH